MRKIGRVAQKEFSGFFASPAAFLFLGVFLAVTLFVFFWVETFFARNIADVRPLFHWMPVLLIFLVAALTMRSWSEERRSGCLETLLTTPVEPLQLVLGKFVAGVGLVAVALGLTLPLPVIIAFIGPLDWGPVFGGYIATLFLAAAYVSIGLYTSARTDNPIVALILTSVVCGLFYLIGATLLTNLFGHSVSGFLALLGTGSRFASITRGVLDFRDLYYYVSIVGVFLTLNLYTLEKLRWAGNPQTAQHRQWSWVTLLAVANFIAGNVWLQPVSWVRADITEGSMYSLSPATNQYINRLQEPLLIRGYFSAKTHPLLAPLVPQLQDLLQEYAVAGKSRVQVEFVDPQQDSEIEKEATNKYGIRPVPFQMASKYQSSVVNSYFDILIAYGDQYEVLGYRDLIEIKAGNEQDLDVVLKNPEYAITSAIRKTLTSYQAGGNLFDMLTKQIFFTGYFSPERQLPKGLLEFRQEVDRVLAEFSKQANGRLTVNYQDPEADGGKLAKELNEKYGFGPQISSLFDPKPFWFYMTLTAGGDVIQVPLPQDLSKATLKQSIESGLRRLAPGFMKAVTLVAPPPAAPAYGNYGGGGGKKYSRLKEVLSENARVSENDLKSGKTPENTDLLLVLAPKDLDEKQIFAIDQFLMQGGSVVLATSPFDVEIEQTLTAKRATSGLEKWLAHVGISLEEKMILDAQNDALPIPVKRYIGPIAVQEIRMLPYSFFADIRGSGLNHDNPITSGLGQVTVNWASPIHVDEAANKSRKVIRLLTSSAKSWISADTNVVPNYKLFPNTGFEIAGDPKPQSMAVIVEGRFDSFFKGKDSPLVKRTDEKSKDAQAKDAPADEDAASAEDTPPKDAQAKNAKKSENFVVTGVIDRSPEAARIILIGSNGFTEDSILDIASQGKGTIYTKPLEFVQNVVDWSLEDRGLLTIRSRGHFSRTLESMAATQQMVLEYLSYGLALLGLFGVWFWRRRVQRITSARYHAIFAEV